MRILLVSMNSIHFRQWASQLEDSAHEVFWFDALGAEGQIKKLQWIKESTNWRLRIKKGRYVTKKIPLLRKLNERNISRAFEDYLQEVKPDFVHSFAMQIAVLPILKVMKKYKHIKWIASSWGSDIFYHEEIGITQELFQEALAHIDYMFTDCERDIRIVENHGFKGKHLGVYPGNGGINFLIPEYKLISPSQRKLIFIKAYDDSIGKGDVIIDAILKIPADFIKEYTFIFLGASDTGAKKLEGFSTRVEYEVFLKSKPISNEKVMHLLSGSYMYIGNSLSDGLPNMLLEAMGNGAFPIQSNPGGVTEEVIKHKKNGLLISNPLDSREIKTHILEALQNINMVSRGFDNNVKTIRLRCNRASLKGQIQQVYEHLV